MRYRTSAARTLFVQKYFRDDEVKLKGLVLGGFVRCTCIGRFVLVPEECRRGRCRKPVGAGRSQSGQGLGVTQHGPRWMKLTKH